MMTMLVALTSRLDNFLQFLGALLILCFVLALAYFVTRWIGNYQKVQMKNRNMQVIETMRVANNKYIQIVKVGEEFLVVSITKDRIEFLTRLEEKSIENLRLPEESQPESFQDILKKLRGKSR